MEGLSDGEGFGKGRVGMGEDFESLKRRIVEMEEKNGRLEVEVRRLKDEMELSYGEIRKLEVDEVCRLRRRNEELSERLMCEKRVAEDEVKGLKERIIELEARVAMLEENGVAKIGCEAQEMTGMREFENRVDARSICVDVNVDGERVLVPTKDGLNGLKTPDKAPVIPDSRRGSIFCERKSDSLNGDTARRQLDCGNERSLNVTQMYSNLPAEVKCGGESIIYISDGEGDEHIVQSNLLIPVAGNAVPLNSSFDDDGGDGNEFFVSGGLKRSLEVSGDDKHLGELSVTRKRKRVSNVIASDSESDDIPIGMRLKKNPVKDGVNSGEDELDTVLADTTQASVPPRRRLRSLSQRYGANDVGSGRLVEKSLSNNESIDHRTTEDVSDDDLENTELESESEGESLGGFIVKTPDPDSQTDDCSSDSNGSSVESQHRSDSDVEYGEIMSKLRRDKDRKMRWKLEGEMLAAFGKDPELCMKAVCALHRQQTSDEKQCKGTIHANGRGFNQFDALRGSEIAEFLTDGDSNGEVKKSVEEFEKYYPDGVEQCRNLATRYSRQLFTIYENKEDPLFLPIP